MTHLGQIISRIVSGVSILGTLLLVVMVFHITLDVACRYLLNAPLPGTIEIVINYYMVFIGFLSLAFTEEKNRNISVELVADLLPRRHQLRLDVLANLIAVLVFGFLSYRNWIEALKKFEIRAYVTQGTTDIPIWPAYFVLPVGCGLILVLVIYKLACSLTGSVSGLDTGLEELEDDPLPGSPT